VRCRVGGRSRLRVMEFRKWPVAGGVTADAAQKRGKVGSAGPEVTNGTVHLSPKRSPALKLTCSSTRAQLLRRQRLASRSVSGKRVDMAHLPCTAPPLKRSDLAPKVPLQGAR
jgi:hypothetical protein